MNTLVIYDSQFGNTKRIARPLPTRCVPLDRRRPSVSIQRVRSRYRRWTCSL
jgi:menaquinone-dependent protoporphyrinogen IX oxidase